MLDTLFRFGTGLFNLAVQIIWLPIAIVYWAVSRLFYWRQLLLVAIIVVAAYFHARYSSQIVNNVLSTANGVAANYYQENWDGVLSGIVRQFYNRFICWYNAFLWFPYGYGRFVVFPTMRDAGWGSMVSNAALFVKQVTTDFVLGFIFTGRFFTEEMDFALIFETWKTFYQSYQDLLCFGCNDICPILTKLPIVPMLFTTDQWKDQAFLDGIGEFLNGWISFYQQVIYIVQDALFPIARRTTIRADFARAFDLWVSSSRNFWRSWENILNAFWVEFIPFEFDWTDVLQFMNIQTTMMLRTFQLLIDIGLNSDRTLDHFSGVDSTYWVNSVKEDYKGIIGLLSTASYFDEIILSSGSRRMPASSITNYELRPTQPSLPNGMANPLFNQILGSSYACLVIERVFCDPGNNGITCAQKYQGTLLEDVDFCCPVNNLLGLATDTMAFLFEFSLHLDNADDFVRYMDKQPFTTQFKQRMVGFFNCAFQFFRIVRNYGFCIERVLFELTNFVMCTGELVYRVLIAAITLPYYEAFLPGETNFISSAGGNSPVSMATEFLDRIADESTVDGFVNCFSYLINTGFQVSFAGCNATSCIPSGFIDPSPLNKRHASWAEHRRHRIRGHFGSSFYNLTSKRGYYSQELTPIMRYGSQKGSVSLPSSWKTVKKATPSLFTAMTAMGKNYRTVHHMWSKQKCGKIDPTRLGRCEHPDVVFERVMQVDDLEWNPFRYEQMPMPQASRLVTQPPLEQVNCPTNDVVAPCFDLSCFFTKLIQLAAHTVAFMVRALNGLIQTRSATGSTYFNGDACVIDEPCLESDLTMFVVKLVEPLGCLCQLVKLLIPNRGGFEDPCCFFTVAGELFSCAVQIIINIGNSINEDAPNYTYIEDSKFLVKDFNIVLRIALTLFDCACDFVRKIFSVALQDSQDLVKSFDPCCFLRVAVKAGLEAVQFLFRVVLSIATLEREESQCYMYVRTEGNPERNNCQAAIPRLPAMQDFSKITVALFATPGESMVRECGVLRDSEDSDDYGAATCYCRTINALLTMVFKFIVPDNMDPFMVTEHNQTTDANVKSTCIIDLCCPVYRISEILKGLIDFTAQFTWTFIQNWKDRSITFDSGFGIVTESFYLPQETFEFFFCDEYGPEAYFREGTINTFALENNGQLTPENIADVYIIDELTGNSILVPLSDLILPNYQSNFSDGTPGLLQNRPLTAPGQFSSLVQGIINTAGINEDAAQRLAREKCGKLEPVIIGIYNLLGRCLCPQCHENFPRAKGIGNAIDKILRFSLAWVSTESPLFPFPLVWPHCLCCGGPSYDQTGIAIPFASSVSVAIRQLLILARNVANPGYWQPAGVSLTNPEASELLADNLEDIKKTWISRFIAPFADATCRFFTNLACILSLLLGQTCSRREDFDIRYKVISAVWAYGTQAAIRVFAVFEGLVKLFTQELPGQCVGRGNTANADSPEDQGSDGGSLVPTCSQKDTGQPQKFGGSQGLDAKNVGRILVALITFVFDALIGVGSLGCTTVCPGRQFESDLMNAGYEGTCACYNLSPYVGIRGSVCSFEMCDTIFNAPPGGGIRENPTFRCVINGTQVQTCTAIEASQSPNTGLTLWPSFFPRNPVPYAQFRLENDECRFGCDNTTQELRDRGQEWRNSGTINWLQAQGDGKKFEPKFLNGDLICESSTIAGTPDEEDAEEYFGKSLRRFPSVKVPIGGGVTGDSRCQCYYQGGTPLNSLFDREWPLGLPPEPPYDGFGCGLPWGPGTDIDEFQATQSVCPTAGFVGGIRYPRMWTTIGDVVLEGVSVDQDAMWARCNACLQSSALTAPTCVTWTTPKSPLTDWIDIDLSLPQCPPGQVYMQSLSASVIPACQDAGRESLLAGTCDGDVVCADEACRFANIPFFSLPANGVLAPAWRQPVCERSVCIERGFCKNDQLVPCARGYGQPVLDGIIITVLKYARCLLNNIFDSTKFSGLNQALGGIVTFFLYFLSVIWQLSGGIVRFSVALFVFSLQLAQGISTNFFKVFGLLGSFGAVVNAFVDIFQQPVVLSVGEGRALHMAACMGITNATLMLQCLHRQRMQPRLKTMEAGLLNLEQELMVALDYPDAHTCLDTNWPQKCFCKTIDLSFYCSWLPDQNRTEPEQIPLPELLTQISYLFQGQTDCSVLWNSLATENITVWTNVTHSRRLEAVQCLTSRSRGESWEKVIDSFPREYFYDTRGHIHWIQNFARKTARHVRRFVDAHEEKLKRVVQKLDEKHPFEKRFGMTHQQYLINLNRRARTFRKYLIENLGMTDNSIMMTPLMHVDSIHFRYRSGYYEHLLARAYQIYMDGDASLMITGSMLDNYHEVKEAYHEVSRGISMSEKHWDGMKEQVSVIYQGFMNPTTKNPKVPEYKEYPEWPFTFNTTRLREIIPILEKPAFNWGPKLEVENIKFLPDIRWTKRIEYNWHAAKRMLYNVIHRIWPDYTERHHHERFIIQGNCRLMDGLIDLGTEVADYCIAEFTENTPVDRNPFADYWNNSRPYRRKKWTNDTHEWKGADWKRPVLRRQSYDRVAYRQRIADRRTYKRAMNNMDSSGRFHLFEWFINIIQDVFNVDLRQSRDSFFADVSAWLRNTNLDPADYPDVGFLYWGTFHLRCEWPENLNCSIGTGLRQALKTVTIYYVVIIVSLTVLLPGFVNIFSFAFSLTGYVLAVSTMAWHYSFGCTIMFPSTAISPYQVTVPILPFPVSILPALPECLWDEIIDILRDVFATSYSFISPALFNNPDGTGFINCYEQGMSDGIQNIIFFGYYYGGNWFVDIVLGITSTTAARIVPSVDTYMHELIDSFRFASDTELERYLFCAKWTAPSILFPLTILWLFVSLSLVVVPIVLQILAALFAFIPTLPYYDSIMNPFEGSGFNAIEAEDSYPDLDDEEEEDDDDSKNSLVNSRIGWTGWLSRQLEKRIMPHRKTE